MLSKTLEDLDTRSAKLNMYLAGLRVPEELEGVIEYARAEAEAIFDRVTWLELAVKHGEDMMVPDPVEPEESMQELFGKLTRDQRTGVVACVRSMAEGRA